MTGTGTQTDPYIVDNWDDFLTINTSDNVFVKWADSGEKIIDFNDIKPEGYTSTIIFPKNVDFNGWTLRNFYSSFYRSSDSAIYIYGSGFIKNLKFENFYIKVDTFIRGSVMLKNCILSGRTESYSNDSLTIFSGCGLQECAVNIKIIANKLYFFNTGGFTYPQNKILNTDLTVDISCGSTFAFLPFTTRNNRITGKIQTTADYVNIGGYSDSDSNVVSLESNAPLSYSGNGISVYNSDLASDSGNSSALKPCTSEQLKNAEYLYSLGFPIGIG